MILTVTPNAAVDKTYRVDGFRVDCVNRPSLAYTVAGGKGINVARVYRTLGGEAVATGFLGGLNGRILARAMREEGMPDRFLRVRGESRLCIAVIDSAAGTQTEVNEPGPTVGANAVTRLTECVSQLLQQRRFEFVVLCGSLPPGVPAAIYASLIEICRQAGVRAVLDSSGEAFRQGLRARPWMVKPNRLELASALGRSLDTPHEAETAARELVDGGIAVAAVTLGSEGAILMTPKGCWRAVPPAIPFASAVASGDSFLAAFLWAWGHGERPADEGEALRLATGAGAANAAVIGAGFCSSEMIFSLSVQADVRMV